MISKSKLKFIRSLDQKKIRKESGLFIAEGSKTVGDLLSSDIRCEYIVATGEWLASHRLPQGIEVIETSEEDLQRASFLRAPQGVLGIFEQRKEEITLEIATQKLCLALDDIQDPGNLGTIVRIADWFGIEHIFCSQGTADIYNPKAVQATMGALARVRFHYTDLTQLLSEYDGAVYGTFLDGENIYGQELSANGIIVMGNEGKGISKSVGEMINRRLYIPNYPAGTQTTESLNVAIATSIVCAEFRRRCQ